MWLGLKLPLEIRLKIQEVVSYYIKVGFSKKIPTLGIPCSSKPTTQPPPSVIHQRLIKKQTLLIKVNVGYYVPRH